MSKFSIIIPVCDKQVYIDRCVDSLVNQTHSDIEIILVSNGPSDKVSEKCDIWAQKDNRIKFVSTQNCDTSAARNAGLDTTTGEYIVFASADSIFEPSALAKCMAEISAHSPDLLVYAVKSPADDSRDKAYMDCNMYTRYEYTESIARYITTGVGFDTVANKVFSAHIINSRSLRFSTDMPLVADGLFNCRYFTIASHIRCVADALCYSNDESAVKDIGTTEYLTQGKEYSQKLIDAVQSKGLYNVASRAIGENYQKILYRHLVMICTKNDAYSAQQRVAALEQLSKSSDDIPLTMYLAALPGIKNKSVYQIYKLRQWKLLISILGR